MLRLVIDLLLMNDGEVKGVEYYHIGDEFSSRCTGGRRALLLCAFLAPKLSDLSLYWALVDRKIEVNLLNVGNYISLNNEVTIEDISAGLQRAISLTKLNNTEEFDAIVHSTGMLVVRGRGWPTRGLHRRRTSG